MPTNDAVTLVPEGIRRDDFALRLSRLADALDRRLLAAIGPWLKDAWSFNDALFVTNEQFTQQVEMMEGAGLRFRFRIEDPKATGRFLAYAEATTER